MERPGTHCTGGLVRSQGRSGRTENLVPAGIRSRTVHPVVSRYTNWAIRPTHKYVQNKIVRFLVSLNPLWQKNPMLNTSKWYVLFSTKYRGADKSLARPGREQTIVSVRIAWISFGALPCRENNFMTPRVSMLLKSHASPEFFSACFLPSRTKDLSAPQYVGNVTL